MSPRTEQVKPLREATENEYAAKGWYSPMHAGDISPLFAGVTPHTCDIMQSQDRKLLELQAHDIEPELPLMFTQGIAVARRVFLPMLQGFQLQQRLAGLESRLDLVERTLGQFTEEETAAFEQITQHFMTALSDIDDVRCIAVTADRDEYRVITFLRGWNTETERSIYRAEYDFLQAVEAVVVDFILIPNADEETIASRTSDMTVLYSE